MEKLNITDEEVNAALSKISNKYDCNFSDTPRSKARRNSLSQLTKKLAEEFDCLGISESKKGDVTQLVCNGFKLVNMHRKNLALLKEGNAAVAKLKSDNVRLDKKIDLCKKEIGDKQDTIADLNRKLILLQLECDDLKKDRHKMHQDLESVKKTSTYKQNEWEHKFRQLYVENQNLKDSIQKNAGNYTSKDDVVAEIIRKYKINEEVYNDTIRKLQDNNQGLIAEILNLKEEVVMALYEKDKQMLRQDDL